MSGWSAPLLPADAYGRGMNRADAMAAARIIRDHGALGAPVGMGIGLVAPTIITHGTREQIDRFLPDIVTGKKWWCQLFSEPGAGSDLAGLGTRAERDGDQWIINGQKVWTSGGHWADLGMLLARTEPTAPKHQGITWFAFDMHQPGADVRTLREMTGGAMFCEVFFSDAVVSDADRIGDVNNGWQVANTTLFHERSGMGAGGERGGGGGPMARAGTVADDLPKRAGDFVRPPKKKRRAAVDEMQALTSPARVYVELARATGQDQDPVIRQALVQSYILTEVQRLNTQRHKAVRAQGGDIAGLPNFSKLLTAHILRHHRDLGHAAPRSPRDAARLRPRAARDPRRRPGRHRRPPADRAGAPGAGAPDLRWDRSDPAQHHRRARPRAPEGARRHVAPAVERAAEERLTGADVRRRPYGARGSFSGGRSELPSCGSP